MPTANDIHLQVMARIVELVELQGQARTESRSALERMQSKDDIVPVLLALVQGNALGYAHRAAAAQLLADWRDKRVLPVLQELVESGVEALQEAALSALYRFGDPTGIDRIIGLLDHRNRSLAGRACDYLGASRLTKVVAPLARVIDDEDPALRYRAVDALANHGSNEARAILEARAQSGDDAELGKKIREALTRIQK